MSAAAQVPAPPCRVELPSQGGSSSLLEPFWKRPCRHPQQVCFMMTVNAFKLTINIELSRQPNVWLA